MESERKSSGTVGKALNVLDLVASFERPVRFNDILAESRYPKATLYRILQNLVTEGVLTFDRKWQTYALGVRLVRLAHSAWTQSSLAPVARPHLTALSEATGETIHLAQLDGPHVLYLDKRDAKRRVTMFSEAGKVGPAYCTGVGKAMLAYLPDDELQRILPQQSYHRFTPSTICSQQELACELNQIRQDGYALDREDHEPGIICVAVPILSRSEQMMGAVSVTSTSARTSLGKLRKHVPELQNAAGKIADAAEYWRFPENERTPERMEI
ncbi:IclR family transcriptional regulator [Hoeflea prorocentri]|uniref:IclR family transcriptional regulator n=1 Tax=Hoeflea prorocentri TaxID=1922333 RepID=A0A9X3ZIY4_9HYPH|nr:IclR family transcriptional regulator [Hoeflea prorocentri]MCY6382230.1 IclR family transcriptional regulator [Hoeflea prorocentri]MDA5400030.1 IclR family transcriptional regulator [Hoeflea prorocentri]